MRAIYQLISWLALAATVLPSVIFMTGKMDLDRVKLWMLVAMLVWFVVTPLWMERKSHG